AEHWDGQQWSLVQTANGVGYEPTLRSVAVAGTGDVWAVGAGAGRPEDKGEFSFSFAQRFVGGSWQDEQIPHIPGASSEDSLSAVVAPAANDVWSVGTIDERPVSEHWDGSSWRVIPTHHVLQSLSMGSDGVLFGVGSRGDSSWAELLCSAPAPSSDVWAVAKPVVFSYPTPIGARGSFPD